MTNDTDTQILIPNYYFCHLKTNKPHPNQLPSKSSKHLPTSNPVCSATVTEPIKIHNYMSRSNAGLFHDPNVEIHSDSTPVIVGITHR
ncbi:hypothetical protein JTE90_016007 [Oedothorax gibbosus]|uniref:Uncharacterized protein n=1 Tax=Oedothorax gibbosus TaxID=931172 RepID=A0AAV6VR56_9ARAC|nr:hypothetical protein JTE90_016007 [Oedothorax gibbosus]